VRRYDLRNASYIKGFAALGRRLCRIAEEIAPSDASRALQIDVVVDVNVDLVEALGKEVDWSTLGSYKCCACEQQK
jgi:hypothetical protein